MRKKNENRVVAVVILIFQTGFPKVSASWGHYGTVAAFTILMERIYTGRTFSAIFLGRIGSVFLILLKFPPSDIGHFSLRHVVHSNLKQFNPNFMLDFIDEQNKNSVLLLFLNICHCVIVLHYFKKW